MASNTAAELVSAVPAGREKAPAPVVSPPHSPPLPRHSRSHSLSSATSTSTIPSDIIRPHPRRKSFPPIPDFRFEQSYLASIKNADTPLKVAYITIRDQVLLPLMQGILWNLVMFGWRHWNRGSKFRGQSLGARIRKWWWGVNNWKLPTDSRKDRPFWRKADDVSSVSDSFCFLSTSLSSHPRPADSLSEQFHVGKFGSSMAD